MSDCFNVVMSLHCDSEMADSEIAGVAMVRTVNRPTVYHFGVAVFKWIPRIYCLIFYHYDSL